MMVAAASLLAQSLNPDADARAIAQLEVQRYGLLRENLDRTPDAAAKEKLTDLGRQRSAIMAKYQQPSADVTWYQLNERVRPLVQAEVGASWNSLMLERFPRPERLRQDYPEDVRYVAALMVIGYEFTLGRTLRPPVTPPLAERDALYATAMEAAQEPHRARGLESPTWLRFDRDRQALSQSAAFKREVIGRYIPLFASFVADDPPPPTRPPVSPVRAWLYEPLWGDEFDGAPVRLQIVEKVPVAALLLTSFWILWQARRTGRKHNARKGAGSANTSLALPAELQFPAFPSGLRLQFKMETAQVLETQVWSETSVSWQSRSAPPGQAPTVSVQTHVTQKERLWVETMDGRQEAWTFSGGVFEAMQGQVVSWIQFVRRDGGSEPMLFYNHSSDRHHEFDWWRILHGSAFVAWFFVMLFWVAPWGLAAFWLAFESGQNSSIWAPSLLTMAVISFVVTVVARAWVFSRRRRTWKQQHRVRLLELLQKFSRGLRQSSGPSEKTSG
jgi:hypothetical protein